MLFALFILVQKIRTTNLMLRSGTIPKALIQERKEKTKSVLMILNSTSKLLALSDHNMFLLLLLVNTSSLHY